MFDSEYEVQKSFLYLQIYNAYKNRKERVAV